MISVDCKLRWAAQKALTGLNWHDAPEVDFLTRCQGPVKESRQRVKRVKVQCERPAPLLTFKGGTSAMLMLRDLGHTSGGRVQNRQVYGKIRQRACISRPEP